MSNQNPGERSRPGPQPTGFQPPGSQPPGSQPPDRAPRALRIAGLVAVCAGVAALAAATFVLSYPALHVLARQAGISPRLARGYPLVIDAMLVLVLAAVLSLRGAGLPSRVFAWFTLVVVLAGAAGADALHAAGRKLPDHQAAVIAAVAPWVLVLLAFGLLLALLRHARLRKLGLARTGQPAASQPAVREPGIPSRESDGNNEPGSNNESGSVTPALAEAAAPGADTGNSNDRDSDSDSYPEVQPILSVPRQPGPDSAPDTASGRGLPESHDLAIDTDAGHDDPSSDEATAGDDGPGGALAAGDDQAGQPGMPVFHRMWSSPTPPAGM